MRRLWTFAAAAIGAGLALAPSERGRAAGAGPFDGTWNVEVECPSAGNIEGYDWRFPAQVSAGALTGSYRSATNSAMGRLSGRIRPDGSAVLTMVGRTGPEPFAFGHVRAGTPFHYTASAHFDGRSGSGRRNEQRPCALTFTRA